DAADPLLLDRHGVDRGDLDLGLRECAAADAGERGGGDGGDGQGVTTGRLHERISSWVGARRAPRAGLSKSRSASATGLARGRRPDARFAGPNRTHQALRERPMEDTIPMPLEAMRAAHRPALSAPAPLSTTRFPLEITFSGSGSEYFRIW